MKLITIQAIIFFLCSIPILCYSQGWEYFSTDSGYEGKINLKKINDGYVIMSHKGLKEVILTKIDFDGNQIWEVSFPEQTGGDFFSLSDNSILLITTNTSSEVGLLKIDSIGKVNSINYLKGISSNYIRFPTFGNNQVVMIDKDNYAIYNCQNDVNEIEFSIIKFNENGEILSNYSYYLNRSEEIDISGTMDIFGTINNTIDGGLIITSGFPELLVTKLDSLGNVDWSKYFKHSFTGSWNYNTNGFSIPSGFLIVDGSYILNLDLEGNIQWVKKSSFFIEGDILRNKQNQYYAIGGTKEFPFQQRAKVDSRGFMKFNLEGELLSFNLFPSYHRSYGGAFHITRSNKIIGTGLVNCYPCQLFVFESNEHEIQGIDSTSYFIDDNIDNVMDIDYEIIDMSPLQPLIDNHYLKVLQVYPKPNLGLITINIQPAKISQVSITIIDKDGTRILTEDHKTAFLINHDLDIQEVPSGDYFIEIQIDDFKAAIKLIKE